MGSQQWHPAEHRMNGQGRKSIPFQLDPLDKSDPAKMFRGAYGGSTEDVDKFWCF